MNKTKNKTHKLVLSGILLLVGLILPYASSHAFGISGTVLLPMHFSVLLCGLLCGPKLGLLCGVLTPLLSSILTGMPPVYPMLPIMLCELAIYGLVAGLLYKKAKQNLYLSLVGAMVCGRLAYAGVFAILFGLADGKLKALNVLAAISTGIVGIALQIAILPILVVAYNRYYKILPKQIEYAKQKIKNGEYSCILIQNKKTVYQADGRGVSPLLQVYENNPEQMQDAILVDKIIGKAAAMIAVLGGVNQVYGEIVSDAAKHYLQNHNIAVFSPRYVTIISNRTGTGICPIEASVIDIDNPDDGLQAIKNRLAALQNAMLTEQKSEQII